ncbi:hypothetical protein B0T17DRAFT_520395 [Bombardia bombarda]|uniref:Uncharacterized protein n=1 Tax=Bombardia bombarda TaxID=252184 RepID=A0AA40CFJ9_9PEZI|nr:hypothetical protein B0T17DRAFT_520395 [Bombardia bombarda]
MDSERIVQHTRHPVYFSNAMERISKRLPSTIWVEARSASPVISMARKALQSCSGNHIFHALDLRVFEAESSISSVACNLWQNGSNALSWQLHRSQQSKYLWLNLPPYQFEKTRHWIEYKQPVALEPEPSASKLQKKPELLQLLEPKSLDAGNMDEILLRLTAGPLCTTCVPGDILLLARAFA